jgi:hypothetical protein
MMSFKMDITRIQEDESLLYIATLNPLQMALILSHDSV